MENQTKLYPSYMGEFYAANPVKFEKRKNNVKPMLYYGLAVSYSEIWVEAGNIYSPPCPTIRTAWTAWDATTAISLDWNATGAKLATKYTYDANGSLSNT